MTGTSSPSPADLRRDLQTALGAGYRIERELGGGGMSRVFLTHDPALERDVVVKVLAPELAAGVNVDRFRREILLAAGLQHPHIVPVLAAGEVASTDEAGHPAVLPYYVMPHVSGDSLRARIAREGALPIGEAVSILRDVARGLAYAHQHGVVHRDIKPENVLLSSGTAAVTDFGVAKALATARRTSPGGTITVVGTSLGTPAYMAPEQAAGDPDTDARADLYAWGVMAYELLAGRTPFAGKNAQALLAAQLVERPVPIGQVRRETPPGLAALVMQCLEKDPDARPPSAEAVLAALDGAAGTTRPTSHWRTLLLGSAAVAVLGIGGWWVAGHRGAAAGAANSDLSAVAVLPLDNTGGDPSDEYFSEGMTDELSNALSRVPGLRVASRTSTYAFKDRHGLDIKQIGRRLGVGAVLEGSVRRDGRRLRLSAQLTNTADGLTIWSNSYEREMTDVFDVQDSLAHAIVAALRPRLGQQAAVPAHAAAGRTGDMQAYDLYLKGRYYWNQRGDDALRKAAGALRAGNRARLELRAGARGAGRCARPASDLRHHAGRLGASTSGARSPARPGARQCVGRGAYHAGTDSQGQRRLGGCGT